MHFTLEALQAAHGDCLLLHWGTKRAQHRMLIDGGPGKTWGQVLRDRLEQLRTATQDGDDPLPIDVLMISHIDDDHIGGIVALTRTLRDEQESQLPATLDVRALWHNAFEDLVGDAEPAASLSTAAGAGAAASASIMAATLGASEAAAVVASVNQGRQLRDDARALAIPVNRGFRGLVRRLRKDPKVVKLTGGLELVILGPPEERLDALHETWQEYLRKKQRKEAGLASVAAYLDESVFNLASIVAVARARGRSILLTGDARGDDILDGLTHAKLLDGDGRAHFDVLKVPHHGSDRNVEREFFEAVRADHYVISADGRHGNPDLPMLAMLRQARPDGDYTLHLTNPVAHALPALEQMKQATGCRIEVGDGAASLLIDLADALPAELQP